MRRTSVSLPTRRAHFDPYEKVARYENPQGTSSLKANFTRAKTAWMSQSPRSRYLKTGGILLFIIAIFYFLAPKAAHGADYAGMYAREVLAGYLTDDSHRGSWWAGYPYLQRRTDSFRCDDGYDAML